jgi:hypothetical protein
MCARREVDEGVVMTDLHEPVSSIEGDRSVVLARGMEAHRLAKVPSGCEFAFENFGPEPTALVVGEDRKFVEPHVVVANVGGDDTDLAIVDLDDTELDVGQLLLDATTLCFFVPGPVLPLDQVNVGFTSHPVDEVEIVRSRQAQMKPLL